MIKCVTALILLNLFGSLTSIAQEWSCPDVEEGRSAFLSGEMSKWPNYSESDGARVQRQFPSTAFVAAQAKFIDWSDVGGATCQYYSHIGLVATSLVLGVERSESVPVCNDRECPEGPYWRYEYTESKPELDRAGKELIMVCMEDRDALAFPSTACGFRVKDK